MSSETYEEELRKVEEELQLLQIELADTIQINDQFLAKIDEKVDIDALFCH